MTKKYIISPGSNITGKLRVASDKSISHRALLLSALAQGESEIINPLISNDVRSTIDALRACGVDIHEKMDCLYVKSNGELQSPESGIIDCGNSGTLMRAFSGIAVGANIACQLIGDESLMRRPMRRVVWPLSEMGANINIESNGMPPIDIKQHNGLHGINHKTKIASAQVKTAILFAGLRADGETTVSEPFPSRDHTERMLETFGVPCKKDGTTVSIRGGVPLTPSTIEVPADMSSAAFLIVGAAMSPNSDVMLTDVGVNPTRFGIVEIIRRMGADVDVVNYRQYGNEPVADIRVCGSTLHGIEISADLVPSAIDDLPALFIAAAAAIGDTILSGAAELRKKESDRISAMVKGLTTLGVTCIEREDGVIIKGMGGKKFKGGEVQSYGDHRIAMAFSIAALNATDEIVVHDCDNVSTSFPGFDATVRESGLRISTEES